jgi:beta-fructofuranosidase
LCFLGEQFDYKPEGLIVKQSPRFKNERWKARKMYNQPDVTYPSLPENTTQYFKPQGDFYAGDCMPFYHNGIFHLYYLLDQGHHSALGGLGGHQWAHAATRDLRRWTHHPLALAISQAHEGSICTGSVFFYLDTYYAFYATRNRDWTQHLCLATSPDGVHFGKDASNPFASPPTGFSPVHYRDPVVFQDPHTGLFHLLATARLENYPLEGYGGCLAHLSSPDLRHWETLEPLLIPGLPGEPECPDWFEWNGWYYLVFSHAGVAHYRMSHDPLGPWLRPRVDTLDSPAARVMKTAAFGSQRRIGAAWIGAREGSREDGAWQFGGNVLLREIRQRADGSLYPAFLPEMAAGSQPLPEPTFTPLTAGVETGPGSVKLGSLTGRAAAGCLGVPGRARITLRVNPHPGAAEFGLCLRGSAGFSSGVELAFSPIEGEVRLGDQRIGAVEGLDRSFELEIVLHDDLIDVCIADQRTLVNRCPAHMGSELHVYAYCGAVDFENMRVFSGQGFSTDD